MRSACRDGRNVTEVLTTLLIPDTLGNGIEIPILNAAPYDLEVPDLSEYKNLAPRWHDWATVKAVCAHISTAIFDRVCDMETEGSLEVPTRITCA
jgi:hypothetical protein